MANKTEAEKLKQKNNPPPTNKPFSVLTFTVADYCYALPISAVIQIIEMVAITPVPYTPKAIQGIINVRGNITPVMDLRLRFNLPFVPYTLHTPLILATAGDYNLALAIDRVEETLEIKPAQLESKDNLRLLKEETNNNEPNTDYLMGVAKVDNKLILILNLEKILSNTESKQLHQATVNINPDGAMA